MQLTVITPNGKELTFVIKDYEAISYNKELTEVMLILLEDHEAKMLQHALEYHSIKTHSTCDSGIILNKPYNLTSTPDYLMLDYKVQ